MGINFKALAGTPTAKFEVYGDSVEGTVEAAEMVDDTNNPGRQVPVVTLAGDDGGKHKLWVRSQMVDAVNAALDKAGESDLEVGARLKVEYVEDRTLRSGRTMKVYAAEVTPEAGF
ncbi:hypothetical protein [Mycolicibacterium sp.]|uniref:hypothetical protein n=1 Tax=Mycolicibacterium sp. TaxID=2320850 RepID=UPI0025E2950E|nr:hypothetical protein [Mycolicibacterium sp.]MCB9408085.1 hypothetical protein [Mycolicibacterium sp.]MCB9424200.1 hypothetical protein [Actinomycetota bacterium]